MYHCSTHSVLCHYYPWHALRFFFLDTNRIDDAGLGQAIRCCKLLQKVDLGDCTLVGDDGVATIARWCPLIRMLHLVRCLRLTDAGIDVLLKSCHHLKHLDLNFCEYHTARTITRCPLTLITIFHCSRTHVSGIHDRPWYQGTLALSR